MQRDFPQRINPDAILEAIIEIRFASEKLPEVFLGRVLTSPVFEGLVPSRLPQADIPMSARETDPNLRFQPIYQLEGTQELVRVGTGAISLHMLPPYRGWDSFKARAAEVLDGIWTSCGHPLLERCGLRYVNALTSDGHGIKNIGDLNLIVSVAGENLVDVTVSFLADDDSDTETLVRVASVKHVQGDIPPTATFVVDLDVRTTSDISSWGSTEILVWLDGARNMKNKHFFDLLPDSIIERLKEA